MLAPPRKIKPNPKPPSRPPNTLASNISSVAAGMGSQSMKKERASMATKDRAPTRQPSERIVTANRGTLRITGTMPTDTAPPVMWETSWPTPVNPPAAMSHGTRNSLYALALASSPTTMSIQFHHTVPAIFFMGSSPSKTFFYYNRFFRPLPSRIVNSRRKPASKNRQKVLPPIKKVLTMWCMWSKIWT